MYYTNLASKGIPKVRESKFAPRTRRTSDEETGDVMSRFVSDPGDTSLTVHLAFSVGAARN
jgi:hypothetical protein